MTKEKQIEQFRTAAEILEKGLEWEAFRFSEWLKTVCTLTECVDSGIEIRIKPKPPEENKYLKAFKEGKRVQWRSHESSAWLDANEYGVKETDPKNLRILTTREVPLT